MFNSNLMIIEIIRKIKAYLKDNDCYLKDNDCYLDDRE